MSETVVIAGAGHAAGQAVASLKQERFSGQIVLIGDEPYLPYQRPPLSKKFLGGEMPPERLYFKPESFYDDPLIELHLNTRIASVEPAEHTVHDDRGNQFHYDKLILALGSRVRRLALPNADLAGIHYLRKIADVVAIRADIATARHVVVVGAGYIGLEVAAVCRQLGLNVTVVELADRVMSRVVSEQVSAFFQRQHVDHGVTMLLGTGISGFTGDEGRVTTVWTSDGKNLQADFVVVGVGIDPETELAAAAGLDVENGVRVDDRCETSNADIYAIGDCTSHPSDIYGRRVRLESVHNAMEQAKTAAANICGKDVTYSQVPWFWSDQYDLKLQIAGLSESYDQTVLRGDPHDSGFACLYLRQGVLIAIDAVNSPRDFMQAKALIAARVVIDPRQLAATDVMLKDLV